MFRTRSTVFHTIKVRLIGRKSARFHFENRASSRVRYVSQGDAAPVGGCLSCFYCFDNSPTSVLLRAVLVWMLMFMPVVDFECLAGEGAILRPDRSSSHHGECVSLLYLGGQWFECFFSSPTFDSSSPIVRSYQFTHQNACF